MVKTDKASIRAATKAAADEAGFFDALGLGAAHLRAQGALPEYAKAFEALVRMNLRTAARAAKDAARHTGNRLIDDMAARHDAENRHEPLLPYREDELQRAAPPDLVGKLRYGAYWVNAEVGKASVLEILRRRDWREAVCANLHRQRETLRIEETAVLRDYQVWMELHRRALVSEQAPVIEE